MKKIRKHSLIFVLAVSLVFSMFLTNFAFASEDIDFTAKTSLTLIYHKDNVLLENVNVKVFKVADLTSNEGLKLSGDFENDPVEINGITDETVWENTAHTLAGYSITGNRSYLTDVSNENGTIIFNDLEVGLYLVTAEKLVVDNNIYTFDPFLVSLPTQNSDSTSTEWIYDVTSYPKSTIKTVGGEPIEYKIRKSWYTNPIDMEIPKQVEVELYCDGVLHHSLILDQTNNWTFSWVSENPDSYWQVVEINVEDGFMVLVDPNEEDLALTNSFGVGRPPETTTTTTTTVPSTETSTTEPTTEPSTSGESSTTTTQPETTKPGIPSTGQLWWPVSLLSAGGLFILLVGFLVIKRGKEDE